MATTAKVGTAKNRTRASLQKSFGMNRSLGQWKLLITLAGLTTAKLICVAQLRSFNENKQMKGVLLFAILFWFSEKQPNS